MPDFWTLWASNTLNSFLNKSFWTWSLFWTNTILLAPLFSAKLTRLRKVDLLNLSMVTSPSQTKNLLLSSSRRQGKFECFWDPFKPILASKSQSLKFSSFTLTNFKSFEHEPLGSASTESESSDVLSATATGEATFSSSFFLKELVLTFSYLVTLACPSTNENLSFSYSSELIE